MAELTPTDELRAAAARIREVAAKATHGDWIVDGAEIYAVFDRLWVAESLDVDNPDQGNGNAAHIALWDPKVAELVAAQLDLWAVSFDDLEWINTRPGDARTRIIGLNRHEEAALALARAINGGAR